MDRGRDKYIKMREMSKAKEEFMYVKRNAVEGVEHMKKRIKC